MRRFTCSDTAQGIFQSREQRIKSGSCALDIYSPTQTDAFYRSMLTDFGTAIVLGPMSVPSLRSWNPMLTIYASIPGFSIFCAIFTKALRDELFAATGGYCALQMVMILGPQIK